MTENNKENTFQDQIALKAEQKLEYARSLKKSLIELIRMHCSSSLGIYENIYDSLPIQMDVPEFEELLISARNEKEGFIDLEFTPMPESLNYLHKMFKQIAVSMSWFRISSFFQGKDFCVFNDFTPKGQAFRSRGFSYLMDALCCISTQPGLVVRLFNETEANRSGAYSVWLNVHGVWTPLMIDDAVPIFENNSGKSLFFLSSPNNETKEIWYMLLEKAFAKAYGSYHNLFNGFESYALRDLTGAPTITYNICMIEPEQQITESDKIHISELWKRISNSLRKGYVLSFMPRLPSAEEKEENRAKSDDLYHLENHLDSGIYASHNYAILAAKEVETNETSTKLIKLRYPWIGEKWVGDWSSESNKWTNELREALHYHSDDVQDGEIWMSINDCMWYYETLNICKVSPSFCYNHIALDFPKKRMLRAVVRLTISKKGKYTFSLDQKDTRIFPSSQYKYTPVKLTLVRLDDGEFKLQSHTSSQKHRNCFIRKLVEPGEYFILAEKLPERVNELLEKKAPELFKEWRNVVFSVYGPTSVPLLTVECGEKHLAHDFLMYESWKWYSKEKDSNELTQFNINLGNGEKTQIKIEVMKVPSSNIFILRNQNDFGIEVVLTFKDIDNMEIVGPSGKISFAQRFILNSNDIDLFILREAEERINQAEPTDSFKILRVDGTKLESFKNNKHQRSQFFNFMMDNLPESIHTATERYPELSINGLYDENLNRIELKDKEVKFTRKSYTIRRRENGARKRNSYTIPLKEKAIKLDDINNQPNFQSIVTGNKPSFGSLDEKIEDFQESRRERDLPKNEQINRNKSLIRFSEKQDLISKEIKLEKQRAASTAPKKSILKNVNLNEDEEKVKLQNQPIKPEEGSMSRQRYSQLLGLPKDELFKLQKKELVSLMNFTGLDQFLSLFELDQDMIHRLFDKLSNNESPQKEEVILEKPKMNDDQLKEEDNNKIAIHKKETPAKIEKPIYVDSPEVARIVEKTPIKHEKTIAIIERPLHSSGQKKKFSAVKEIPIERVQYSSMSSMNPIIQNNSLIRKPQQSYKQVIYDAEPQRKHHNSYQQKIVGRNQNYTSSENPTKERAIQEYEYTYIVPKDNKHYRSVNQEYSVREIANPLQVKEERYQQEYSLRDIPQRRIIEPFRDEYFNQEKMNPFEKNPQSSNGYNNLGRSQNPLQRRNIEEYHYGNQQQGQAVRDGEHYNYNQPTSNFNDYTSNSGLMGSNYRRAELEVIKNPNLNFKSQLNQNPRLDELFQRKLENAPIPPVYSPQFVPLPESTNVEITSPFSSNQKAHVKVVPDPFQGQGQGVIYEQGRIDSSHPYSESVPQGQLASNYLSFLEREEPKNPLMRKFNSKHAEPNKSENVSRSSKRKPSSILTMKMRNPVDKIKFSKNN